MTPSGARESWENAVNAVVGGQFPVLGMDSPRDPEVGGPWVRAALAHVPEVPAYHESGSVQQGVVLSAVAYAPFGERSAGDVLAEQLRAGLSMTDIDGGLEVREGRFQDLRDDDVDAVENYTGLRVVFPAAYDQEG